MDVYNIIGEHHTVLVKTQLDQVFEAKLQNYKYNQIKSSRNVNAIKYTRIGDSNEFILWSVQREFLIQFLWEIECQIPSIIDNKEPSNEGQPGFRINWRNASKNINQAFKFDEWKKLQIYPIRNIPHYSVSIRFKDDDKLQKEVVEILGKMEQKYKSIVSFFKIEKNNKLYGLHIKMDSKFAFEDKKYVSPITEIISSMSKYCVVAKFNRDNHNQKSQRILRQELQCVNCLVCIKYVLCHHC